MFCTHVFFYVHAGVFIQNCVDANIKGFGIYLFKIVLMQILRDLEYITIWFLIIQNCV